MDIIVLILSATLSIMIITKINVKYKLFKDIRSKINNLNEKKDRQLRVVSYILVLVIYGIMQSIQMNIIIQGLIFGLLLSFRDICFEKI